MSLKSATGGAYIPPARLKLMQEQITDKNSPEYQRIHWEALKKSINGLINKVNISNMAIIVRELLKENIIRGRGLLCRSLIQAQSASPTFTHIYACLVAIINSKFPQIGELLLKRIMAQFKRCYRRNDKQTCLANARFLAHLVNQEVAHEVIALQLIILLLENATNDSVEIAISFIRECGSKITALCPAGVHGAFESLRSILHEGNLDKRVQYMIEVIFAVRKDGFKDYPSVIPELDLIEESEKYTHTISLDQTFETEDQLNVFKYDDKFEENEASYAQIKKEILDEDDDDNDHEGEDVDGDSDDEDEDESNEEKEQDKIIDHSEASLVALRRTIYLTFQSSLDFEECCHKILKLELKPDQVNELCYMVIDCCAQQRTYLKFYGLLAQRFCAINQEYAQPFSQIFKECYEKIHRFLDTKKLRNVAKLFAHLLFTDSIPWTVLSCIKLNEEDTTSSSRVFIKILFQELEEYMGFAKLNSRIKDPTLEEAFKGLFPRDNPRNTRFSINFFTLIGLGPLTDDLRDHLKCSS